MKLIRTVFVICFLHQFMLTICHPENNEEQSEGDREHENVKSEEILLKELDKDPSLDRIKLYSNDRLSQQESDENERKDPEQYHATGGDLMADPPYAEQYEHEKLAGDPADTFGTNMHHYYPTEFKDLGRRFVLQYPYKEVNALKHEVEAESVLDNVAKANKKKPYTEEDLKLLPVKASPELVLRVAIESAMDQANQPQDPYDIKEKDMLRTGEYWDSLWVETVNPETVLRSFQEKTGYKLGDEKKIRKPNLNSLKTKIMPGSKLYELVSVLKKTSPRLLYVINDKEKTNFK